MIYTIETLKAGLAQINQSIHQFMLGLLIAWAVQAVVCALISANVAKEKGYNPTIWAFTGLIFGGFALLGLIALPSKRVEQALPRIESDLKELKFLMRRVESHLEHIAGRDRPEVDADDDTDA
jgi:hypothetical protein